MAQLAKAPRSVKTWVLCTIPRLIACRHVGYVFMRDYTVRCVMRPIYRLSITSAVDLDVK